MRKSKHHEFRQAYNAQAVVQTETMHIGIGPKSYKRPNKFANLDEDHYFSRATIRIGKERLVFVTSFHHVGRELSGIMEATAFAQIQSFENSDDREYVSQDFFPCSFDPFVFTCKTVASEIDQSFGGWLDAALAIGLKEFADRL